jgi:hypothetical protein
MTIVEIHDSGKFVIAVDGFIPASKGVMRLLHSKTNSLEKKALNQWDQKFLLDLGKYVYKNRLAIKTPVESRCDLYIVRLKQTPDFPNGYAPIFREAEVLTNRQDNFRIVLGIVDEDEAQIVGKSIVKALKTIRFEVRDDTTYSNLNSYRGFLTELSRKVASFYAAPFIACEKYLQNLSLVPRSESIL